jgi:two-component system sensor histidine kinase MprB
VSFRRRLTLACAAAVALAVVLAAGLTYWIVRDALRDQIDGSLASAGRVAHERRMPPGLDGPAVFSQRLRGTGVVGPGPGGVELLDSGEVAEVARGERESFFTDVERDGRRLRVYTERTPNGSVLQVARPLTEVDATLATLRLGLGAIVLLGVGAALVLGFAATRTAVKPVTALTHAAEHVARTRDLTRRIEREGDDELSRLAGAFNTMLEALDESQRAQRRLVADASHELRTPLTSLRTNLEVLGRGGLDDADQVRLRADVIAQLEELTLLVSDLVDLAREEEPAAEREALRLDELVAAAVERARRHAPGVTFTTALEPVVVDGVRGRLDRAVANLLDNAAKYSDAVEVTLRDGTLVVRDHGPGIAEEDLPFVFDRFYRAASARGKPGSGLGLAIVRQAAEAHGGTVHAATAPDGGAIMALSLSASS